MTTKKKFLTICNPYPILNKSHSYVEFSPALKNRIGFGSKGVSSPDTIPRA
uniref:Uncharacterized protein n=1 Tax=Meloidogyne incognita TaxID=6306 RepID=A0A914LV55_MELIC